MSALPPKADSRDRIEYVCFVPIADIGWSRACGAATFAYINGRKTNPDRIVCKFLFGITRLRKSSPPLFLVVQVSVIVVALLLAFCPSTA